MQTMMLSLSARRRRRSSRSSSSSSNSSENQSSASSESTGTVDLFAERDDWYGELSGGQRVKAEMIAKVFMRSSCPHMLLLDEAFAPLDPKSKELLQNKLKAFCAGSLILVIYHSEASSGCLAGGRFFYDNLHFENGTARLVGTC